MGDLVGQSLAHFRIVEKLGEGGMGVVYKATDEKLHRTVALKVLPESLAQDPERRARLAREARAAAAVTHPNIATVHEVGESGGTIFIAMEYVEGRTLRELLGDGPLPIPRAIAIGLQVARGLAKAQQAGVVHRDLKPENVIVGESEHVKLVDFGLAKLWSEEPGSPSVIEQMKTETQVTAMGRLLGTPGYMSPEQARGKEVDARTDVFAFGVMLFEMVTGERPFAGETTHDVLAAVTRDAPRRPSELNALVPAGVERIVERCLEKLPEARYANGHELADALLAMHQRPSASQPSVGPGASTRATASVLTPAASSVRTEHRRSARGWVLLVAPSSSPALPTPVGESPSEVPAPVSARQLEGVAGPPR